MSKARHSGEHVIRKAFLRSLVVIVVIAVTAVLVYQFMRGGPETQPVIEADIQAPVIQQETAVGPPVIRFTDITRQSGIDFKHVNGAYGDKLLPETMGGGVAFIDYDNDGDQDLILVNSRNWSMHTYAETEEQTATTSLYQNDGTGKFTDVSAHSGLALSSYGMGIATGDIDNDGWTDVYITTLGKNHLFQNKQGRFVDITADAGVAGTEHDWSMAALFFDYDNDGDLDLFAANYVEWSPAINREMEFKVTGLGRSYSAPLYYAGAYSRLYRNEGNNRFTDVSESAGITEKGKALGVTAVDYDHDGRLDLFVANDTTQNFLYRNTGDGKFEESGMIEGIAFDRHGKATGAMGIDAAWYRNDIELGVAIGNFANEMSSLFVTIEGKPPFADEALLEGLGASTRLALTFGVFYFDADLDGRADLLQANGHLEQDINNIQPSQQYEQPAQLFWNCGENCVNRFQLADDVGDLDVPMVARGSAYADIDNDGDLDVIITQPGRSPKLFRNDQNLGHHWLRLLLEGSASNRSAIGATVVLTAGGVTQKKQVMPGRSYLSQVEMPLVFGLGNSDRVDDLTITWPGGAQQKIIIDQVDAVVHIKE
jgi:hypothetical protein